MKINIKHFCILYLISIFFCDLRIPLIKEGWLIETSTVLMYILLVYFLIFYRNNFLSKVGNAFLSKNNSLFLYLFFCIYLLVVTIIGGILGKVNLLTSLTGIILQYIVVLAACYSVVFYSVGLLKTKTIIKILYGTFYVILLFGIVDFIAYTLNITLIQDFLSLFFDMQVLRGGVFTKVYILGIPRVQSIYFEPGFFAEYIFFFMPLLYSLSLSKYRIFKNSKIDFFVKKTTIPVMWFDLISTMSPIWLVFGLITTGIFFLIKYIEYFRKHFKRAFISFIAVLIIVIGMSIPLSQINWKDTYVSRIIIVAENFNDVNKLIFAEQSFGTRLSNIINIINIGMKSPLFGIGHSNIIPMIERQINLKRSPVYITDEMKKNIIMQKTPSLQNPPLSNIFCRYGIVGLLLYYSFIFRTNYLLYKNSKKIQGLNKNFILGLSGMLCGYIVMSCYDITIGHLLPAMIIGLGIGLIHKINILSKRRKDDWEYAKNT